MLTICVDFDGTVVRHRFPDMGEDVPHAERTLKDLVARGYNIILYTMRDNNSEGDYLDQAIKWYKDRGIPLYSVNHNPDQDSWTTSPKCYAQFYIDDLAVGAQVIHEGKEWYVDWLFIRKFFDLDFKKESV